MTKGFHLMFNVNFSRPKQKLSRGYKLLHVSWNTLYVLSGYIRMLIGIYSLTISICGM